MSIESSASSNRREVMLLLDKVFDYLTLDELSKMWLVNKFFWYVATMESLYIKFGLVVSDSQVSESLWSSKLTDVYATYKFINSKIKGDV